MSEIVFASTESLVGAFILDIEQGLDTSSITLGSRSRKTDRGTYLGFIIISISCQELKTKARIINQAIVNQSSKSSFISSPKMKSRGMAVFYSKSHYSVIVIIIIVDSQRLTIMMSVPYL